MLLLHTIITVELFFAVVSAVGILLLGTIIFTIYFNRKMKEAVKRPLSTDEWFRNFAKGLCLALVLSVLYILCWVIYFAISF